MRWCWLVLAAGGAAGCGDEEGGGASDALEIAGQYQDDFGGAHVIDSSRWQMDAAGTVSRYTVLEYSNSADFLVAQNDAGNGFAANLFSRFDWTEQAGQLWFCQTAFAADTRGDAAATPAADPADPASGGCGGFPWSKLTPAES